MQAFRKGVLLRFRSIRIPGSQRSRVLLAAAMCLGAVANQAPATVRIGVFTLFRPQELTVRPINDEAIGVRIDHGACTIRRGQDARLRAIGTAIELNCAGAVFETSAVHIGRAWASVPDLELSVPGRIIRTFRGLLDVTVNDGELVPVVSMDLETAVASVVSAEQSASTPFDALAAQAVAARSYLVAARGRHRTFDFCDTTHCQFLKSPPELSVAAARAAAATAGMVVAFRGAPIAALYSASCGGRTRTLVDAGLSSDGYPYFSVECEYCRLHAPEWESRIDDGPDLERLTADRSERARLAAGRRYGWSAVPGNGFEIRRDGTAVTIHGRGAGHGIGLCQAGAAALAADGVPFRDILAHYYPGTTLTTID